MIYSDVPLDKWCAKYKLTPKGWDCPNCKTTIPVDQPIFMADCVGLTSKHACGPQFEKAILRPRTAEAKAFWNRVGEFIG